MEQRTLKWLAEGAQQLDDATMFKPFANRVRTDREEAVAILLGTIDGEMFDREGLLETPKRVAKMYDEIFSGYQMDPKAILSKAFAEDEHHEMVIVKDIPFYSHCEHHMVPFFGHAHIAYIPNGSVVGLSKLARLVDCYSKRLQIQERLTSQIADMIDAELSPMGVMVVIQAEHMCMSMRGVKKPGSNTVTSAVRGVFKDNANVARAEFLSLIDLKK
jgi:GTP cyclohydrolase I